MENRFTINLRGIVDLLSNHLYSGPQVYVRELLQNCADAILARQEDFHAFIRIETFQDESSGTPAISFEDNGIGLSEDEVPHLLSTVGLSSTVEDIDKYGRDYIGQFGIAILACCMVSDEIVVRTRSAVGNGKVIEWRGRPDGTYSVQAINSDMGVGTRVTLLARRGCHGYFEAGKVQELVRHMAHCYRIELTALMDTCFHV